MRGRVAIVAAMCCLHPFLGGAQPPSSRPGSGKVLTLGNLTYTEVDALDRQRSMFLLPVGILEEHGPHLPIAIDQMGVDYEAAQVARRLSRALPAWNIVVMPALNYGSTGANVLSGSLIHPGTYAIRQSTLRAIVADIGAQVAQNGFKWMFIMNGHGAPTHHAAVNEAGDFISETFNVTMVNVSGLFSADSALQARGQQITARHYTPTAVATIGLDRHAGTSETSWALAIRPDLVKALYRRLPDVRAEDVEDMRVVATRPGWQGYWSSPSRANASYGRDVAEWWVDGMTSIILRGVRGEDLRRLPRFPSNVEGVPAIKRLLEDSVEPERAFEQQLERWLAQRRRPGGV